MMSDKTSYAIAFAFVLMISGSAARSHAQPVDTIPARHRVTLKEAHTGTLHVDTLLLDSYEAVPGNVRKFYLEARKVFTENKDADFTHEQVVAAAKRHDIRLMGGPMLGNVSDEGVSLWLRPATTSKLRIIVKGADNSEREKYTIDPDVPGEERRMFLDGLKPGTEYRYTIYRWLHKIAEGTFRTAPASGEKEVFRLAFGSCFHKIGLHNPNLINQVRKREPNAMMLIGDIAVDDRYNNINMHRADYLLRDVSNAWQDLAANVPLYAAWDDHDYLDNDLSGIPDTLTTADREALREVWYQNWNNPAAGGEGIYFNTRIGPVELIMLDTRSCRIVEKRGEYGAYLGHKQQNWLKATLQESTAPYKIISSGTMWSDDISNGKDSWGTWDTLARKEIFELIKEEDIPGVILISGDRHGARAFKIPVSDDFSIYEFEAASLGGVPGPDAMAKDPVNQLFGYTGSEIVAFGEFTFDTRGDQSKVVFRLIDETGKILEEHTVY
jgi:alkaline phosphatase D